MRFAVRLAMLGTSMLVMTTTAQGQTVEVRVERLERDMRTVQNKLGLPVAPGGALQPQITAPVVEQGAPGTPLDSPVAIIEQRVNALEGQVQTLTGQVEQTQYKLRQMEEAFNAYKLSTNARLKVLEDAATSTGAPLGGDPGTAALPPVTRTTPAPAASAATTPARGPGAGNGVLGQSRPSGPAPAATAPATRPAPASGARAEQLAAIERPASGDAAEDLYVYGFRLWQAKLYPEARAPLAEVVAKYPKHRRASFAQNLLGRAWLDEGKNAEAAKAFYDSYIKLPDGERAADSLFYLSQALQKLKAAPAEQCKVYKALELDYPGKLSLDQQAVVDRGKAAAKCS
ncbi:hypothetical protein NYR55_10820 [Sphingomonas sp. BGYR3]|uniref:hypothetical protein n=1 Tax=Sphingomonas sp. BGYR3 TaxID=2975483 RepID=UPI0021A8E237|nr:hypothetical protein [Sphingomonas sp. BGYR3]MDG5489105.1 hypothetical protein [Sphingomonas sp. BGYR3]